MLYEMRHKMNGVMKFLRHKINVVCGLCAFSKPTINTVLQKKNKKNMTYLSIFYDKQQRLCPFT